MRGIVHDAGRIAGKAAGRGPKGGAALALAVLVALATGCGWGWHHHSPEEQAEWFFERGESWIVDALEDVDAGESDLEGARAVLEDREPEVKAALEAFLVQQRALLQTIASGAESPELLERQARFDAAHESALREIGAMHAEIAAAVGEATWSEARERMRERAREHLEED